MEIEGRGKRLRAEAPAPAAPAMVCIIDQGTPDTTTPLAAPSSYKVTLTGTHASQSDVCQIAPLTSISDDDILIGRESRGPTIKFSKTIKEKLLLPWKNALIVKLLGAKHSFKYFEMKLRQKWSMLKGAWSIIDISDDYYIVRFDLHSDRQYVLTEGPWIITGHYLTIQNWEPGFTPSNTTLPKLTVWLRISALHVEWFNFFVLTKLGNMLGTLHKVDMRAVTYSRGQYARLCVELDLTKPLETEVQVDEIWYTIQYEALHLVCFNCGIFGHDTEHCPSLNKNNDYSVMPSTDPNIHAGDTATLQTTEGHPTEVTPVSSEKNLVPSSTLRTSRPSTIANVSNSHAAATPEESNANKQWQTVKPRRGRRPNTTSKNSNLHIGTSSGSRFEVLPTEDAKAPSVKSKPVYQRKAAGSTKASPSGRTTTNASTSKPRVQTNDSAAMHFTTEAGQMPHNALPDSVSMPTEQHSGPVTNLLTRITAGYLLRLEL